MPKRLISLVIILFALALWTRIAPIETVRAATTITVNTDVDADPPDTTDGACSVREALINANDNAATFADCAAGDDDGDFIFLDLPNDTEITLVANLPDPTESVTIQGREYVVQIDLEFSTDGIDVANGVTLTLHNVYIDGDDDFGDPIPDNTISVEAGGTLILDHVELTSGNGSIGGTIHNEGDIQGQFVQIYNGDSDDQGGAIYNDGTGTIDLSICGFFDNYAVDDGGAIYNEGTLVLNECELSYNVTGSDGGAIYNAGTLSITDTLFDENQASGDGGAIAYVSGATTTIKQSILDYNYADIGGGIASIFIEAMTDTRAPITGALLLDEVVLTNNFATTNGGAVYIAPQTNAVVITNSSLIDNTSTAGIGGIFLDGGTLTAYNTTIAYNLGAGVEIGEDATADFNHLTFVSNGNTNISASIDATLTLANSVFAFTTTNCVFDGGATINLSGGNLSGDSSCGFGGAGDNATLTFGSIGFFSGFGYSVALEFDSDAIDFATAAAPADIGDMDADSNTAEDVPFDGRADGFARQIGTARDSGAFEYNPTALDFVVDRADDGYAGACTAAANDCTLRGAVNLSNYNAGTDTITFAPSVTEIVFDPVSALGFFNRISSYLIFDETVIDGPGIDELTIAQDKLDTTYYPLLGAFEHSIFFVNNVVSGPFVTDARGRMPVTSARGTAMHKPAAGGVPLEDFNVIIRGLTIVGGSDLSGGAVEFFAFDPFKPLTDRDALPETQTSLLLQDMHFVSNEAISGGAVTSTAFGAPLMVRNSTFTDNTALATLNCGCTLSEKRAGDDKPVEGGFGFFPVIPGSGGAIASYGTTLQVFDSTFDGNRTGDFGTGGAIYATFIDLGALTVTAPRVPEVPVFGVLIVNTTFNDNQSYGGGTLPLSLFRDASPSGAGGAIYSEADIFMNQVTFAGNDSEYGSSLYVTTPGFLTLEARAPLDTVQIVNTIFADGTLNNNCDIDFDYGINLVNVLSDDDTCDGIATDLADIGLDPLGLQDNGGPTATIALTEDSGAINAGSETLVPDLFDLDGDTDYDELYPFDQRGIGFDRFVGCAVDIGAFEYQIDLNCGSDLTGTILTDDAAFLTDPITGGIDVTEGATIGDLFCVVLDPEPADDVTVTVQVAASASPTIGLVDPAAPLVVNSFFDVFFDVSAVDTTVCNADQILGVTAPFSTTDAAGTQTYSAAIEVVDSDDDVITSSDVDVYDPGMTISPMAHNPVQEGASTSYTVALSGPPGIRANTLMGYETVTLNLRGYNSRFATPSPLSLPFTRANWSVPQTVTVLANNDNVHRGGIYNNQIQNQASSNVTAPFDSRYGGAGPNVAPGIARVRIVDNDLVAGEPLTQEQYDALNLAAWLDLAPTGATALEGNAALVLQVRIAGQPLDGEHVVIDLSSLLGVTVTPSQLVFTANNWDVYQPVVIGAPLDEANSGLYSVPLQVVVNGAETTALDFVGAADAVQISIADDPALIPPIVNVPEQPAPAFVPVPETNTSAEGTTTE